MSEPPNGPLADGSIVGSQGGDGNAVVHQPREVSYTGKLIYLWDAWEKAKALAAIAALDAPLLRPLLAPLLRELKATLRGALDSMRDMEATEPLRDELLHASLEDELFDAWKLTRAVEASSESSEARLSSLFAPLLNNLEATLRGALDTINVLDRPDALPPERDGHAASQPVANDHTPEVLADRPEMAAAAPPSGNGDAATNGRDFEALAELPDLVTLNQAAAIVHCSKRTMERYRDTGKLPVPIRKGKNGKAHLYDWKSLRSALEELFDMNLPEKFPANGET